MKIIYCTRMFTDTEENVKTSQNPYSVSGHKFQENMLRGLVSNSKNVRVINSIRVPHHPDYHKKIIKRTEFILEGHKVGINVAIINYFLINFVSQFINVYRELLKETKNSRKEKCILITFNSYIPQSLAMLLIRLGRKNIVLCDAIGDLHGKFGLKNPNKGLKGFVLSSMERFQDYIASKFDCYVFLTKYMREVFDMRDKKYVVVEGFAPIAEAEAQTGTDSSVIDKKRIFYAGSLWKEYGILHLLKAFSMINGEDYELVIAGKGGTEKIIEDYSKRDPRVKYVGFLSPEEVREYQKKSTVLVSPRLPNDNFVKYSFPSKTMECLASGIPYVAHKLPCDPQEYNEFIQYADGTSDKDLKDAIVRICEMKNSDRIKIGTRGQAFILSEKNPEMQCRKIVKMLESM